MTNISKEYDRLSKVKLTFDIDNSILHKKYDLIFNFQ